MHSTIKQILKPFSSLKLTVVLLAASMVLIFVGTWAQLDADTWAVQKRFFHSWFCWVEPQVFLRRQVPGGFPFVGGYFLITALLVNLLAAHIVRFKMTWKRTGIILIHLGLIMLLAGEALTSTLATEGQITLAEGQAFNYKTDIRAVEIAVTDSATGGGDRVTVIPEGRLKTGKLLHDAQLPFDLTIDDYLPNSRPMGPVEPTAGHILTSGDGAEKTRVIEIPLYTGAGADAEKVNSPSAQVTLTRDGKTLGTYLLSLWSDHPEKVKVADKVYPVELRFKREYTPYTIQLLKFTHEKYIGTDTAKNFASRVRLVDPARGVDREVLIWMNHPLRYEGETFYQQGFDPKNDRVTTLQIVRNPSWLMPYAALAIAIIGLVLQFGSHLVTFLRRQLSGGVPQGTRGESAARVATSSKSKQKQPATPDSYVLVPAGSAWDRLVPAGVVLACLVGLVMQFHSASESPKTPFDLAGFGQLPVNYDGRPMPIDTLARTSLKIIRARDTAMVDGKSVPATQWLLDLLTEKDDNDAVFRIDNQDILSFLSLDQSEKYFTIHQIISSAEQRDRLQRQIEQAQQAQESGSLKTSDVYQRKILELADHLKLYIKLRNFGELYFIPPAHSGGDWQKVTSAVAAKKADPAMASADLASFMRLLDDYAQSKPESFNATVADYRGRLEQSLGSDQKKFEFEAFFNRFDPFQICMVFYVLVFMLAIASWLGFARPLGNAALSLLGLTLLLHSFGLICRIYISGRPPVTSLYSSAVFIAWGAVLLAAGLELIFRNGIGSVAAASMGFASLLIAQALSITDGDTMKPLQAVLSTNFWLATHVVVITLGYASTYLAGILALIYIFRGMLTRSLDANLAKTLTRMTYGIICFALLFSFVGTILGGIWADQSWGRFWGWDPKENGAILIVLWNAIILHARWGGLVKARGMMILAVFGNVVTTWSWFGVNMLGIGLHTYGFMDRALPILVGFVLSQLAIILIANIPTHLWRSFADQSRETSGRTPGIRPAPSPA